MLFRETENESLKQGQETKSYCDGYFVGIQWNWHADHHMELEVFEPWSSDECDGVKF